MYNFVERRGLWFTISLIFILPGLLLMIYFLATTGGPLPVSIDFTGGTLWEIRFQEDVVPTEVRQVFVDAGYTGATAFNVDDDQTVQIKFDSIDIPAKDALEAQLTAQYGEFTERSYRSIGPAIGTEVSRAAVVAVLVASLLILVYIAIAFSQVAHPIRYGTSAVVALLHDVMVTISFLTIMYFVAGWEIDALFLTAILTVIGFSVNDTIVIFDRIRENLRRYRTESFATVANRSIIETAQRSIATQVTALLVLVAILVLGGATLRQFMATLIVGLVSGTYSSLFTATPILAAWEEGSLLGRNRESKAAPSGRVATASQ